MEARAVDSCPPPGLAVETKTPAYLPQSAPEPQRPPVVSQKALNWAGKLPKRVGIPKRKALNLLASVVGRVLIWNLPSYSSRVLALATG